MGIILWIIFGAIVGWLASIIMKTDAQQGPVLNIVLGIIGALVGGFLMNMMGYGGVDGFNLYSMFVAILGSVVVLAIAKAMR